MHLPGLSLSRSCRGMLVSCSHDGTIKVWDLLDHSTGPVLAWEQTDNLGALYCLAANPDNEFIFALGGDNKEHNFKVLDFMEIPAGMSGSFQMKIERSGINLLCLINSEGEIHKCDT